MPLTDFARTTAHTCSIADPTTCVSFFFFNAAATPEIYTLSLHDALPICRAGRGPARSGPQPRRPPPGPAAAVAGAADRKSTRLNSSHPSTSYAVFCLKKKNSDAEVVRLLAMAHTQAGPPREVQRHPGDRG